jgi:hypothetical protein
VDFSTLPRKSPALLAQEAEPFTTQQWVGFGTEASAEYVLTRGPWKRDITRKNYLFIVTAFWVLCVSTLYYALPPAKTVGMKIMIS